MFSKAVSSASSELEGSAGTLAATAQQSQQTTTVVAAASEEASTNVQSVATATEDVSLGDDHTADWHVASRGCGARFVERDGHPIYVCHCRCCFADPRGVEPLTPGSVDRCSIH